MFMDGPSRDLPGPFREMYPWECFPFQSGMFQSRVPLPGISSMNPLSSWGVTNVVRSKDGYRLSMDAPGCVTDDIVVRGDGQVLSVKVSRPQPDVVDQDRGSVMLLERSAAQVDRSFRMPVDADLDRMSVSYVRGVLVVEVPFRWDGVAAGPVPVIDPVEAPEPVLIAV